MFGSSIIDIAIGMVFIYLLLSLICSAGNEIIERYSRKRATDLENGIKEMLQNPQLVQQLYEHPLVNSLFAKPYTPGGKNLPSYIPARNFALALMDLIGAGAATGATSPGSTSPVAGAMDKLKDGLDKNTNLPPQVKQALQTLVDASHSPAKMRENIENWFDSSMDRVSGFYKRRSQLIVLIFGLLLTIFMNVDSIALVRSLSTDRAMRDSLVAAAAEYAKTNPTPPPANGSSSNSNSLASPSGQAKETKPTNTNSSGSTARNSNSTAGRNSNTPSSSSNVNSNGGATNTNSTSSNSGTNSPSSSPSTTATSPAASPTPCVTGDTPECRIKMNLQQIEELGLPIGWTTKPNNPGEQPDPRQLWGLSPGRWVLRVLGWLITALALSLGAPFWFDLLNKFMVVRATVKPKEKSADEPSKG